MQEEKLRLAVIGAGLIAQNSHVPAALGSPRASLTAIVDPETTRPERIARTFGIEPTIARSVTDVLQDFDAAIICTPNHTHASIAVDCLNAGKHVLIDKPMATSVAEAEAILEAADRASRQVAIGYATRFRDNIDLTKKLVDDAQFGRVLRFVNRFGTRGGWSPKSGYILEKASSGGGVLVVSGTHFLDRMLYWFGYPDACSLEHDAVNGPEANCRARFEYQTAAGTVEGYAIYSKTAALAAGSVIETELGFLIVGEFDSSPVLFRPKDQAGLEYVVGRREAAQKSVDSFALQMDDFVDACISNRPPKVDGAQGLASMRLIESLYANATALDANWYGDAA